MKRIQEIIIQYRNHREDRNQQGYTEELNSLAMVLGCSKKLAQAIAEFITHPNCVVVEYKNKKYLEDFKVERNGNMLDWSNKFRALGIIFDRIKADGGK